MPNEYYCGVDNFAASLESLLGTMSKNCQEKGGKAVAKAVRKTAKDLRGGAYGSSGVHKWSAEYMGGFKAHVSNGIVTTGEIGNKAKPGLVHLLEKGHATLTGRRTRAFPHMEPAFNAMSDEFVEEYKKAIGEALK